MSMSIGIFVVAHPTCISARLLQMQINVIDRLSVNRSRAYIMHSSFLQDAENERNNACART